MEFNVFKTIFALSKFFSYTVSHQFTMSCYGFPCMSHENVFCLFIFISTTV